MDEQLDENGFESVAPKRSETLQGKYPIRVAVGGLRIDVRVTSESEGLYREAAKYADENYSSYTKKAPKATVGQCLSYALFSMAVELKRTQAELESLKKELDELNDDISRTLFTR